MAAAQSGEWSTVQRRVAPSKEERQCRAQAREAAEGYFKVHWSQQVAMRKKLAFDLYVEQQPRRQDETEEAFLRRANVAVEVAVKRTQEWESHERDEFVATYVADAVKAWRAGLLVSKVEDFTIDFDITIDLTAPNPPGEEKKKEEKKEDKRAKKVKRAKKKPGVPRLVAAAERITGVEVARMTSTDLKTGKTDVVYEHPSARVRLARTLSEEDSPVSPASDEESAAPVEKVYTAKAIGRGLFNIVNVQGRIEAARIPKKQIDAKIAELHKRDRERRA